MKLRPWQIALGTAAILLAAIQFIPYGRQHANPPTSLEPAWDSPQTRQLAVRACFDCHSNQTVWPWYASIAPISWLAQADVESGREVLNFSAWEAYAKNPVYSTNAASSIDQTITGNTMPPGYYLFLHPDSILTPEEKNQLLRGFEATLRK